MSFRATKQQQRARGSRETLFFVFFIILFIISFILLIQFNYYFIYFIYFINSIQFRTYVSKDAGTRRLPESTARSSRARSHGLTGPLSVR